ncbi:methyl-accepting chemotaxis protein [Phormidesmis sp. 146-33]
MAKTPAKTTPRNTTQNQTAVDSIHDMDAIAIQLDPVHAALQSSRSTIADLSRDSLQIPPQAGLVGWWQRLSVRVKATALAIVIGTTPVLIIGGVAYYFANQSITTQTEEFGKSKAADLQNKASLFMRDRLEDIKGIANLDAFTDPELRSKMSAQDKAEVLTQLLESYRNYDSIAIFALDGNVIAQTPGSPLDNQLNQDYFQAALKTNGAILSQPVVSKSSGIFSVEIASTVKDKVTGQPIAVVRGRMPVEFLEDVIRNFGTQGIQYYLLDASEEIFIGPTGTTEGTRVRAVPSSGVQATDFKEVYSPVLPGDIYPDFKDLKAAEQADVALSTNTRTKTEQLLAYSPPVTVQGLPDLNWRAIISMDTAVAFAPQQQLLSTLTIGTGITALLVAILATLIANRATRPILAAAAAVEKIGQGDLKTRLRIRGEDEVASLGDNINYMANQLQLSSEAQTFEASQERQLTAAKGSGVVREKDLQLIFDQAVEDSRRLLKLDRIVIYRFDTGSSGVISESVEAGWSSALDGNISDSCIPEALREAYQEGRIVAVSDVTQANFHPEHLKLLEGLEVKASLIVPIASANQPFGLLIAHSCSATHDWQEFEINFLKRLGYELGLTIYRVELLEQTTRLAEEQRQLKEGLQKRALELLLEVDPISKGDLTTRAKVTVDEIGTIADSYNATVDSLRKIVLQVQESTDQVVETTSTSETSVQLLSGEALRQAEEIGVALDLVKEMAIAVREVAANAEQAEVAVRLAAETVKEGDEAMNRTVDGIQAIRVTVAETAKKVKYLGESSQKISTVVDLISAFAAQTNMLALNASIAASRAGEDGRSFAVVAEEVRALARQSADATGDIKKLVVNIQTETREVVAAMESGTEQVVMGTKLVDETRQSLNKITAVSTQIGHLVEAIAQATVVQSKTSETVAETIQDVAAIANKTSNEANQVSFSFAQLRKVAQTLQESVGKFKVS